MEYFGRSNEEARQWIKMIENETRESMLLTQQVEDPNHPGPQDGTGVNSAKKGSITGLTSFNSPTNQKAEEM